MIAPSFGDIFAQNAIGNGLLPARVGAEAVEALIAAAPGTLTIDLPAQRLTLGALQTPFDLDPVWKTKLINGWDDIDLTARHRAAIDGFATARRRAAPWLWPNQEPGTNAHQPGRTP